MANLTVFDNFVLGFVNTDDLVQWALEYGHFEEPIVQHRLSFLRGESDMETNEVTYLFVFYLRSTFTQPAYTHVIIFSSTFPEQTGGGIHIH